MFEITNVTTLPEFVDNIGTDSERRRTIYEVLKTAKYSEETIGRYINGPILSKHEIWDILGDYISHHERSARYDISPDLFYTIRLDGRRFSKEILPYLSKRGIISSGYSLEFEDAMKYAQRILFESTPNAICSFCQSDEITILVGPVRIGKSGERGNLSDNGRFQKYISHPASLVSSSFVISLINTLVNKSLVNLISSVKPVEFDARIAQYDSFESAMQLILWRSYDCSVNGISSGIHLNKFPNKSELNKLNSTGKLRFLQENGILDTMTDHQLYGTFLWNSYTENIFTDLKTGNEYKRAKITINSRSDQLLTVMKTFMCDNENSGLEYDYCLPESFRTISCHS